MTNFLLLLFIQLWKNVLCSSVILLKQFTGVSTLLFMKNFHKPCSYTQKGIVVTFVATLFYVDIEYLGSSNGFGYCEFLFIGGS